MGRLDTERFPAGLSPLTHCPVFGTEIKTVGSNGFEPLKAKSQQIYSLSPLAARATPRVRREPQVPAVLALAH